MELWYNNPAEKWCEALPLGNGRLGAMVFSGTERERIALNEDTLWSGYPGKEPQGDYAWHREKARKLALAGKLLEAEAFLEETLPRSFSELYLPMGDLALDFAPGGAVTDYRRSLELNSGVCRTDYTRDGVRYHREAFTSVAENALVLRFWADTPGCIGFDAALTSPLRYETYTEGDRLLLAGQAPSDAYPFYVKDIDPAVRYDDRNEKKGMRFHVALAARLAGGSMEASHGKLSVRGADEAVLYLTARTSYAGFDRHPYTNGVDSKALALAELTAAVNGAYAAQLATHEADFRRYFDRVELTLSGGRDDLPTVERLLEYERTHEDADLYALLFQYGRYLLISSSRPGTEAANLQGIWNEELRPAWSSNYTSNQNTQMNYWPAESCNLSELHFPLFDLLDKLMVKGADIAQRYYGARGVVAHHNHDIWGYAAPAFNDVKGATNYAYWAVSFGWLCGHLYEHYLYTCDKAFLRDRALPCIRAAARFYLDDMTEDETGHRFLCPDTSPETRFLYQGESCALSRFSALSNAIIREVLGNYLKCVELLGIDDPMEAEAREALGKVYPYLVGGPGVLLERDVFYPRANGSIGSTLPMYGLYPGHELTWEDTPALAEACQALLESNDRKAVSFVYCQRGLWRARLGQGDEALRQLDRFAKLAEATEGFTNLKDDGGCLHQNLFATFPPFQMDANWAVTAAVAELLIQSRPGEIRLLPALPGAWRQGTVSGLRAQGGVEVDMTFAEGALTRAVLRRTAGEGTLTVRWPGGMRALHLAAGESAELLP